MRRLGCDAYTHVCGIICLVSIILVSTMPLPAATVSPSTNARVYHGKLPLSFELNQGQADQRVKFVSRGAGYQLFLKDNEATLVLGGGTAANGRGRRQTSDLESVSTSLQMTLVGANSTANVVGLEELPGKSNYFIGNDPKKWRTNVPTYARVRYHSIYPGIDLVYYGNQEGQIEYDFIVAPGTDPKAIAFSIAQLKGSSATNSATAVSVSTSGDLLLHDANGDIRFQKPIVYQEDADGKREYREGRYVLASEHAGVQSKISFALASYDHSRPLVIDPAIVYSTVLRGTPTFAGNDSGNALAVFSDPLTGHTYAYVVGETCDLDFPVVNAEQSLLGGNCEAFVTKFDPAASGSASLLYSTYLGGSDSDGANGIAVDSSGNVYVAGVTHSVDFPTTQNAYLPVPFANSSLPTDAFLTKLSADGATVMYSSYFGGSQMEAVGGVALDSAGHAYIAGGTYSPDLPTANPFQASLPRGEAAFVAEFDTTQIGSASLIYSTYLGGSDNDRYLIGDRAFTVAVDSSGMIHLAGQSNSSTFPVLNGFQLTPTTGSSGGAFYSRLNPALSGSSQLVYSTYLGGRDNSFSSGAGDTVEGMALDSGANAYLVGDDVSGVFPITTSVSQNTSGFTFVAKINSAVAGAHSLVYSTLIPKGRNLTGGAGIAVDASGNAFVTGSAVPGLQLVNPILGSANGVLQSSNGGQTWTVLNQGLTNFPILALAIDTSTSPRTIYAGTGQGNLFASSDGGLTWNQMLQVPSTNSTVCGPLSAAVTRDAVCVMSLAIDPTAPSNVYAGTTAGVYKSSDRGLTWTEFNAGLTSAAVQGILALQFDVDSHGNSILYAGATDGLYTLNSGDTSWVPSSLTALVGNIAIDTSTDPYHTIFTGPFDSQNSRLPGYRSQDGGATWTPVSGAGGSPFITALGVDTGPVPSTVYGLGYFSPGGYSNVVWKSVDEGSTWTGPIGSASGNGGLFAYDGYTPGGKIQVAMNTSPSTTYAMDPSSGIISSMDGGNTWSPLLTANAGCCIGVLYALATMAIDSTTTPSTVYAGTGLPFQNGFVAKLDPSGSTFIFSTYLGGIDSDAWANAIALDGADNIYVTGATTYPRYFPAVNAYQTPPANVGPAAFFTVIGSQTLPASSSSSVTSQVAVQNGMLAITLPNITGSTSGPTPTLTVDPVPPTTTANYGLSNNLGAFDVSTTATFSGSVTLCFQAQTVNDLTTFNNLQLFHIVNGTSIEITSSRDFSTRTVCGTTTSLSPFVLFSPSTSTIVASALNPSIFGQSVTFTAMVSSAGTATGTVTFNDGPTVLGTVPLTSGQASFTTSALGAGSHTITATYTGDSMFLGSTSFGVTDTVNRAGTAVAVSTAASPSILHQNVSFTATVSAVAPGAGMPTGSVTFLDGNAPLGTVALSSGLATLTTSSLAVGSHAITAVYAGDTNFSGATSAGVSQLVRYEPVGTTCVGAAGHQILQPINSDGTSVWKQGRTIPAQFRVCDAKGISIGSAGVVSSFYLTQIVAGTVTNVDETVSSNNSDTAFHWDATNQQWVFNLSTKSLAAGNTYVYTITLNDGTTIGFQYGLK